jgi:hypothetical protein
MHWFLLLMVYIQSYGCAALTTNQSTVFNQLIALDSFQLEKFPEFCEICKTKLVNFPTFSRSGKRKLLFPDCVGTLSWVYTLRGVFPFPKGSISFSKTPWRKQSKFRKLLSVLRNGPLPWQILAIQEGTTREVQIGPNLKEMLL